MFDDSRFTIHDSPSTTVLCFGTFDGFHLGHEDYFRQAKTFGDRLVVVIARDETVQVVKGRKSRHTEKERCAAVQRHPFVDEARLGETEDKYEIIQKIRPDVIVLGYDQRTFTDDLEDVLRARGLSCKVVRAKAYQPDRYKSSLLNV